MDEKARLFIIFKWLGQYGLGLSVWTILGQSWPKLCNFWGWFSTGPGWAGWVRAVKNATIHML